MRNLFALVAGALLGAASPTFAFGPLEEPDAVVLGDNAVQIIDIRPSEAFEAGHIPGAVNAPYRVYRGPAENPGQVPDVLDLQDALRAVGLNEEQPVLVVHAGDSETDFGAAAQVYWTLKTAGFPQLAVLNGGYEGWAADEGNEPDTGLSTPEPSTVEIAYDDSWWIDAEGVAAVIDGRSDAVLIDARPGEFFRGETKHDAAGVAGTLQGAINFVHEAWFGGSPRIEPSEDVIAQIRAVADEHNGAPLVSFCNTGHWAATNWFATSELAGIEGVKLYPESMVGWTGEGRETVEGLIN
mgnify:FL=1